MSRREELYREGYRKPYPTWRDPSLVKLSSGNKVIAVEVRAAGIVEIDGVKYEFQDVTIIMERAAGKE